jgi:hypothetical protein
MPKKKKDAEKKLAQAHATENYFNFFTSHKNML